MSNHQESALEELRRLSKASQRKYIYYLRWLNVVDYFYPPLPVRLGLKVSILIFVILAIMPLHPMVIPASIGAAISFVLIFTAFQNVLSEVR